MAFNKQRNCMSDLLRPNRKSAKDFRDHFIGESNGSRSIGSCRGEKVHQSFNYEEFGTLEN